MNLYVERLAFRLINIYEASFKFLSSSIKHFRIVESVLYIILEYKKENIVFLLCYDVS